MLNTMVTGSLVAEHFVTSDVSESQRHYDHFLPDGPASANLQGTLWHDDHLQRFRQRGWAWPVDFERVAVDPEIVFIRTGLSDRAAEVLYYVHKGFPFNDNSEPEFMDCNPALPRVVAISGDEERSPWKVVCPTLIGSSHMCIRHRDNKTNKIVVRPITPLEAFAFIGFQRCDLVLPIPIKPSTALNMAGNAFSAFAVLPALNILFQVWDCSPVHPCWRALPSPSRWQHSQRKRV